MKEKSRQQIDRQTEVAEHIPCAVANSSAAALLYMCIMMKQGRKYCTSCSHSAITWSTGSIALQHSTQHCHTAGNQVLPRLSQCASHAHWLQLPGTMQGPALGSYILPHYTGQRTACQQLPAMTQHIYIYIYRHRRTQVQTQAQT